MTESTPLKVLIAEDEPAMLSLVARHVRSLGFSVVEASEGDVAYELAKKHRPDLVILDVMMPGMSGWEVCKRLKGPSSDGAFAKTGVIMLTGIGENLNDMTSPLFAADAWLNKPFDFNDLDAKIRETLDRYAKPLPTPEAHAAEAAEVEEAGTSKSGRAPARKPAAKKAAKKAPAKKPAAKKAPAKKAAVKKPAAKKATKPVAKAAAKKPPAKPAAKKPAAKKPAAKKPAAKKPAAKKPAKAK